MRERKRKKEKLKRDKKLEQMKEGKKNIICKCFLDNSGIGRPGLDLDEEKKTFEISKAISPTQLSPSQIMTKYF